MKKALFALIKYWLDVLLTLMMFTIVYVAILVGTRGAFAFSVREIPAVVISLVPYAVATGMVFAFPRVTSRLAGRPLGYVVLFLGAFSVLCLGAVLTPFSQGNANVAPTATVKLPVHTLIAYDAGHVWASSVEASALDGVVMVRSGATSPRISYQARVSIDSQSGVLSGVGMLTPPEVVSTTERAPIVDALNYEDTSAWWRSLGTAESGVSARFLSALALALAFTCVWPISRIGAWPMVAFSLSCLALVGVFAIVSVARTRPVASMLSYVDIHLDATMTVLLCCTIVSVACVVFDLVFLKRPERR